jgi:formiminotetrahydrofolate cyclodeaminase
MNENDLRVAMIRAFQLGQEYWAQADSESPKDWKKSDETRAKFEELREKTVEAFNKVNH